MTPEELLRPRVKVVKDYPNSPFEVGMILTLFKSHHNANYRTTEIGEDHRHRISVEMVEKYPNFFYPLKWWEYRDEKDMPMYVKNDFGSVCRVIGVITNLIDIEANDFGGNLTKCTVFSCKWLPATKEEYNQL